MESHAILKIQHSGGTGTSSCVVHKMMNYQIDKQIKKQKTNIQTNRRISNLLQSYFFINCFFQFIQLALCCSFFFFGGVMRCGEQVTNCHYFIQSSFTLHSLHFELSRIYKSFLWTLYYIIYYCISLQSPSMSENPLISCYFMMHFL